MKYKVTLHFYDELYDHTWKSIVVGTFDTPNLAKEEAHYACVDSEDTCTITPIRGA